MWKKVNQQKRKQRRVIEQRIYKYTCVARLHVPYNIEYKKTIYRQFIFIIYLGYIYVYTLGILFDLFIFFIIYFINIIFVTRKIVNSCIFLLFQFQPPTYHIQINFIHFTMRLIQPERCPNQIYNLIVDFLMQRCANQFT